MKRPTEHAARVGVLREPFWYARSLDSARAEYVERDPGDYTGRHRLIEGGHNGQFYMGCPSCVCGAKS